MSLSASSILPVMSQVRIRPTHFVSLPLGHDAALRQRVKALTDVLATADPPPSGFDPSIVIPERRLHLTLAVCALRGQTEPSSKDRVDSRDLRKDRSEEVLADDINAQQTGELHHLPALPTRGDAAALLQSCRDDLRRVLDNRPFLVALPRLGSFSTIQERSHVLFARPSDTRDSPGLLQEVAGELNVI